MEDLSLIFLGTLLVGYFAHGVASVIYLLISKSAMHKYLANVNAYSSAAWLVMLSTFPEDSEASYVFVFLFSGHFIMALIFKWKERIVTPIHPSPMEVTEEIQRIFNN